MPIPSPLFDPGPIIERILAGTIWSPHFPLRRTERLAQLSPKDEPIPRAGGLYRIHREGNQPVLAYVGHSSSLRRRINELATGVYGERMPFTTPHVAAPALWAWAKTPPYAPLTLSFVSFDANTYWQQGLQHLIIAFERGQRRKQASLAEQAGNILYSPLAQYGKMPHGWSPSSTRTVGERGEPTMVAGPWHVPSIAPVSILDDQQDAFSDGWGGHEWSAWCYAREVPMHGKQKGLYRLRMQDSFHLWYVGCGQIASAAREAACTSPALLFSAVMGT